MILPVLNLYNERIHNKYDIGLWRLSVTVSKFGQNQIDSYFYTWSYFIFSLLFQIKRQNNTNDNVDVDGEIDNYNFDNSNDMENYCPRGDEVKFNKLLYFWHSLNYCHLLNLLD